MYIATHSQPLESSLAFHFHRSSAGQRVLHITCVVMPTVKQLQHCIDVSFGLQGMALVYFYCNASIKGNDSLRTFRLIAQGNKAAFGFYLCLMFPDRLGPLYLTH